nr:polysaccharide biosynthesis C-terminal domain-containing protein [Thermoflexales bacterium]
ALIINLIMSLALINVLGVTGLALSNTTAATIELVLLVILIRKRLGGLEDRRVLIGALKTALASIVMGMAVWAFLNAVDAASVIVRAFGGVIVGAGVFAIAAWLLRVEELRSITGLIRRKIFGHG